MHSPNGLRKKKHCVGASVRGVLSQPGGDGGVSPREPSAGVPGPHQSAWGARTPRELKDRRSRGSTGTALPRDQPPPRPCGSSCDRRLRGLSHLGTGGEAQVKHAAEGADALCTAPPPAPRSSSLILLRVFTPRTLVRPSPGRHGPAELESRHIVSSNQEFNIEWESVFVPVYWRRASGSLRLVQTSACGQRRGLRMEYASRPAVCRSGL